MKAEILFIHFSENMMSGQPQEWQTDVFRSSLVRKLEEAIRDSGNQTEKNAVDLEKQVGSEELTYLHV